MKHVTVREPPSSPSSNVPAGRVWFRPERSWAVASNSTSAMEPTRRPSSTSIGKQCRPAPQTVLCTASGKGSAGWSRLAHPRLATHRGRWECRRPWFAGPLSSIHRGDWRAFRHRSTDAGWTWRPWRWNPTDGSARCHKNPIPACTGNGQNTARRHAVVVIFLLPVAIDRQNLAGSVFRW